MGQSSALIDLSGYPALLTVQDVADLLQISVPTVRAYLRHGELTKIKVGHSVRISRLDLERYLMMCVESHRKANGGL